jgi:hypothetical protein
LGGELHTLHFIYRREDEFIYILFSLSLVFSLIYGVRENRKRFVLSNPRRTNKAARETLAARTAKPCLQTAFEYPI